MPRKGLGLRDAGSEIEQQLTCAGL